MRFYNSYKLCSFEHSNDRLVIFLLVRGLSALTIVTLAEDPASKLMLKICDSSLSVEDRMKDVGF